VVFTSATRNIAAAGSHRNPRYPRIQDVWMLHCLTKTTPGTGPPPGSIPARLTRFIVAEGAVCLTLKGIQSLNLNSNPPETGPPPGSCGHTPLPPCTSQHEGGKHHLHTPSLSTLKTQLPSYRARQPRHTAPVPTGRPRQGSWTGHAPDHIKRVN
jgi:hypothetical protein